MYVNAYLLIKMKWIYYVYITSEWIHGDIYSPKTYAHNLGTPRKRSVALIMMKMQRQAPLRESR